jgi:VWFA-related protein
MVRSSRWMGCAALCLLVSGMVAMRGQSAAAPAQDGSIATLNVNARIVVLDVVVTDKAGNVVNGLGKEDFKVWEDKAPQEVRYFEAPEQHVLPAGVTVGSTAELQEKAIDAPVTILVLDEINSQFSDMAYARSQIEKYVNAQPKVLTQPTELIAVDRKQFTLLHDFTQDGQALLASLKAHQTAYPWMLNLDKKGMDGQIERLTLSISSLEQITQALQGHTGRKNIVWVGVGYPGLNVSDTTNEQDVAIRGMVQKAMNMMRDNRVMLYVIDPTELSSEVISHIPAGDLNGAGDDSTAPEEAVSAYGHDPFASVASFIMLAPETGGHALWGRNDLATELSQSIREGANFYTLFYKPTTDSTASSAFRKITVRVREPGLKVTTREGYYGDKIAIPVTEKNQMAFDLATASSSALVYTGLGIVVTKDPKTPDGFIVHVATRGLGWKDAAAGTMKASVVVQAVSFGAKDKVLGRTVDGMGFGKGAGEVVNLPAKAEMAKGTTRIRFVVRDQATGRMGTADYTVQ